MSDEFVPGDVVSVNIPNDGQREGLVIGTSIDTAGRQIVQIQFEGRPRYYNYWYPEVKRVRRSVYPYAYRHHHHPKLVERQVHYEL